jgi:hypothetical protein
MKKCDIIIIGGGAAGMMAGIGASRKGKSILIVEKNLKLGRKVLATGNGRCNVTNRYADKSYYHGASPDFVEKVLSHFDQHKVMKFFENLGVLLKEEDNGRIFPRTNQAETIVDALAEELEAKKVQIILSNPVRHLIKEKNLFQVKLQNNEEFLADKIILTTGGKASEQYGAAGDGYAWAENFGHHITALYPALVPLETNDRWPKAIQGLKVEAKISLTVGERVLAEKSGDVLFTHYGLSGLAVLALAGKAAPFLTKHKVSVHLDFFPEETYENLDRKIAKIFNLNGKKSVKNSLTGVAPSNFIPIFLSNLHINPDKKAAEISKKERLKIAAGFKNIVLAVSGTRPFKEAQMTAGGVDTKEINPETMESKIVPGLYLAGEILDVNADSGGYNLQWAWSSGYLAGMSASK